jgi:AraC-like DNA-binding protein
MTGVHILIAAVFIVFVIAFIITILVLNANAKKIISTNTKLVESQNMLFELNKQQGCEIETLQKQQEELAEQLRHAIPDEEMQLRQQIQEHREQIEHTSDLTDEELMAWVDLQMDEKKLFTDTNLTLKTMAKALGLTQKRLGALFKDHAKYNSLGDYINEKRFLYACQLLREQPNWTIEAVGTEAGFGGRRTFQTEVKRRLGITPLQYRQSQGLDAAPKHK